MGFLKFLKKGKKPDVSELDLPPEPPPLEGFEDKQGFELPEIKAPDDFDMPKFDVDDIDKADSGYESVPELKDKDMPDFPGFPEMEDEPEAPAEPEMQAQPIAAPAPVAQPMEAAEQEEMPRSEPHMQRKGLFHHERKGWEKPARRNVYVRVDKFKAILDGISMIRASVRKSDEAMMRLESIKNSKDMSFDRLKMLLEDLQKKLIFIDKTLFKGD